MIVGTGHSPPSSKISRSTRQNDEAGSASYKGRELPDTTLALRANKLAVISLFVGRAGGKREELGFFTFPGEADHFSSSWAVSSHIPKKKKKKEVKEVEASEASEARYYLPYL